MDKLFSPDVGLMVWTVATFLLLVAVLARYAWGPILAALRARDETIQNNLRSAEQSRREADALRREMESRLAGIETRAREIFAQAEAGARRLKDETLRAAQTESRRLVEAARKSLEDEERRVLREVRAEVAGISLHVAEKILRRGLDPAAQERLLQEALDDFDKSVERADRR